MVARGAGAAGPVLLACRQRDPLGLARRLPSLGVRAWRSAPLLPWRMQCPVRVCAALAAGSGGSGRYLVLCLSRSPLPAPRVPRCVWRAVPSGCPLPLLAGTPFQAVCAFRELGPVALLVVPACPLRVCALALPRRPLPLPLGGVACAPRAVPALGADRAVRRGLCPSACPAPVPCSVWCAMGGAARARFPPTWLGAVGVAEGRPRGGCLPLLRGASEVRRSPSPDCPPTGRAVGVHYPRAVGLGPWVWGPNTVPLACTPCGGCVPRGWWKPSPYLAWGCAPPVGWVRGVRVPEGGLGGGMGRPVRRAPRLCGRGGSVGRGVALPGSVPLPSLGRHQSGCHWRRSGHGGRGPPKPLRFLLVRLHGARSVRRPGALARARLFPAVPVGAGGWGGGAGHAPAPLSGGGRGDHPPCLGGWQPGPPRLAGRWGGRGGEVAPRPPSCPSGWRPAVSYPGPPLVFGALPPGVRAWSGSRGRPGGGGMRSGPWTAPPGALSDLNPPSALPEWARVMGGVTGGAAYILFWSAAVRRPQAWSARRSGALVWARPSAATPAGAGGWGRWGARCAGPAALPPPPPRRGPFWGRGGVPSPRAGRRVAPAALKLGGGSGGRGVGGAAPPAPAPRPVGRWPAIRCLRRAPPGYTRAVGVAGRPRASGAARSAANGSVRRGGGGGVNPPALVRAPVFPRPASEGAAPFAPSWAQPVRRLSAAGRAGACGRLSRGACRGRGAPSSRVQRPLRGGCGAAVSSVCLRPLLGLRGRGGEVGGGLWSPGAAP